MTPWPGCVAIVLLLLFTPLQARRTTQTNTLETGVIARAPYYIEIPAKWNKGLVLHLKAGPPWRPPAVIRLGWPTPLP